MPLASEDRLMLRDLISDLVLEQRHTNELLEKLIKLLGQARRN